MAITNPEQFIDFPFPLHDQLDERYHISENNSRKIH